MPKQAMKKKTWQFVRRAEKQKYYILLFNTINTILGIKIHGMTPENWKSLVILE